MSARGDRLSTGTEVLDRRLDGGFPAGSVVAYRAPPASQSELFLYELTATRDTLYLTTDRSEAAVRDAFDRSTAPVGDPNVRYVSGDAPLENARRLFRDVGEAWNLILDPVDVLERTDAARYRNFLNELQTQMQNTGGVAVLHCLDGAGPPETRDATTHMADAVFDLQVERDGGEIETELAVLKFRGGRTPQETIKLELSERVRIDTSRDIA